MQNLPGREITTPVDFVLLNRCDGARIVLDAACESTTHAGRVNNRNAAEEGIVPWDSTQYDLVVTARLHARIEIGSAEIRTIESLPLQPRARAIVEISKVDLECARVRLAAQPDSLELEYIGRWLEMIESQLRTVRAVTTELGPPTSQVAKTA